MFNPTLVHEYLALSAKMHPNKVAIICGNERLSYEALDHRAVRLAQALIDLKVKRHDRVAVFLDNSIEAVVSLYGIMKAGGVLVMLNSAIKAKKLNHILRDAGVRHLITHAGKSEIVRSALHDLDRSCQVIWIGDAAKIPKSSTAHSCQWDEIFKNSSTSATLANENVQSIDSDLVALIYTSGSSGEPKGVVASHLNVISAARSVIQYLENTCDDIILNVLPLAFGYGLYQIIMSVMCGATVVLEPAFTFPLEILQRLAKERATGLPVVPSIVAMLLATKSFDTYDLRSLRYITSAGAALPVEHIHKLRALFPAVKIYSMYGLTECARVAYLPPEELGRRPSSVGKAMPNCEVFIVDEEGEEVAAGQVGELVVRGTHVMRGYWNAPGLTATIFRSGRLPGETLLYSGDLFRKDEEGFLYFVGRKDDMIKTKGERVSPKEIENVLHKIKGIKEAAVVGVSDEILGQAIKAFVVCDRDHELTRQEVLKFCAANLERFMIPKYLEFVKALPSTPNGKTDKNALQGI
jgi:amino acid adenylation domain-containing protein